MAHPHQAVTKDLIERIDAALTATRGHRAHAAQLLGISETRINNTVARNEHLRAKWVARNVDPVEPGAPTELHREAGIKPFSKEELACVEALDKEESLLQKGWDKLNFTDEKQGFLLAIQNEHGRHWGQLGTMFQGGVAYTATELLFRFNKIMALIDDVDANPEKYERVTHGEFGDNIVKSAHECRLELIDRALAISEMFRKLNADRERAELIKAQVEKIKVDDAKNVKKRAKPAWEKPEVTVDEGPEES